MISPSPRRVRPLHRAAPTMKPAHVVTLDANEAVASVAYRMSEVIAIYPITPASPMGEWCDEWSAHGRANLWGGVARVVEMQSEAGAAGAVHGALQAGAMATTFTASHGLLLMIPDMFKIAGELTAFCMHVAARSVATHALSIFGDHSDVMAARATGFAMLCAASVQEAQDFAAIAHAATLRARVPFLHFFDGFRTSHEVATIEPLGDDDLRALVDEGAIAAHRARALDPEHPVLRGTAQNPDAFMQAREAINPWYDAAPATVRAVMRELGQRTERRYDLFDYAGHPEAERVIVVMGSGAETVHETVDHLVAKGERVGVVKVRLYRPFDVEGFARALPGTVTDLAVLDRTKEPGAVADPLHLDVLAALDEAEARGVATWERRPRVLGGRYGLGSKEFTPAMARAIFERLATPRGPTRFTVGITDDVTRRSLAYDVNFEVEGDDVVRAVLYGIGADGTVGSNKNTVKILGEETALYGQGYFEYDSRKAGSVTVSHLRFAKAPIRSAYKVRRAQIVACHQPALFERMRVLDVAAEGATVLLNAPWAPDDVWTMLPDEARAVVRARGLSLKVIDAHAIAREVGLGGHISAVMQAALLHVLDALPHDVAMAKLRASIEKSFKKHGPEVVAKNLAAVDRALAGLRDVPVPDTDAGPHHRRPKAIDHRAPDFVQRVTAVMLEGLGDALPVSAFPVDGTWPVGTARWEQRSLAQSLPAWEPELCIQCNKCSIVCPHAAIRTTVFDPAALAHAPAELLHRPWKGDDHPGTEYVVQVAPDDCTGCGLCVVACPAKDKRDPTRHALAMAPAEALKPVDRARWDFVAALPPPPRTRVHLDVKGSQLLEPLFEFSGACAGCGETPYLKLMTQLFGDRALVANATGCSSIFGANLPTTPWRANADGRGPAWSNSLFEDNAEFGLGMRLATDTHRARAEALVRLLAPSLDSALVDGLLSPPDHGEAFITAQRERVAALRTALASLAGPAAHALDAVADWLVPRSVWIVGGDGWAYDIGYGGLDHVLASGADVNVLVLDTEVYSNTGGQQSKATPLGATARFAAAGKRTRKKDLALHAMAYGHVYVASVALGAKDAHTVKAFLEAERWKGPSLLIAYSHCVAHGYDLAHGLDQQRLAVETGVWPLFRFDPSKLEGGESPLHLDAPPPKRPVREYLEREGRFRAVAHGDPAQYERFALTTAHDALTRRALYEQIAALHLPPDV